LREQSFVSARLSAVDVEPRSAVSLYLELGKVRLCTLVVVTTLVGFLVAAPTGVDALRLLWTLVGTMLAALGANALNQCLEVQRDARMERTVERPLPSRRLRTRSAWRFALTASIAGPVLLFVFANALAALLAAATLLIYVLLYTPMKVQTPLNTLVGAVVGALPPMVGWAAARGELELGAWILAAILFFWQIPHFLSLAWMYREDYRRGGFRMLPVLDETGTLTSYVILLYSLALLPITLWITAAGLAGPVYAIGALLLGSGMLWLVWRLLRERSILNARRVFLGSVAYLPLLLGLMVFDRVTIPVVDPQPLPSWVVELQRTADDAPVGALGVQRP
jgi:protoheme IX farnesyltransferase